ncbi:MAG: ATP-NAD kinase-like domain-containing protein [Monoraphidium minutum]|nr:MAG: ATP-NAD kinase-like domain-containing protein [Monoraphidium minutum]
MRLRAAAAGPALPPPLPPLTGALGRARLPGAAAPPFAQQPGFLASADTTLDDGGDDEPGAAASAVAGGREGGAPGDPLLGPGAPFALREQRAALSSVDLPTGVITVHNVHPETARAAGGAAAGEPGAAAAPGSPGRLSPGPGDLSFEGGVLASGGSAAVAARFEGASLSFEAAAAAPGGGAAAVAAAAAAARASVAPAALPGGPGLASLDGISGDGVWLGSALDAHTGLAASSWTVRFTDSSALRLRRRAVVVWENPGGLPQRVLVVKKLGHPEASRKLLEMAEWLARRGVEVFVEPEVAEREFPQLSPWDAATSHVDFAVTLGGDGTVLHLASLFDEQPLPPVLCFAMGTLGFLTPFDANDFKACLSRVLAANSAPLYCTLRTRKRCEVYDAAGVKVAEHHVLNDAVIDRGSSPVALLMEVYVDGSLVTVAEGDGLIVATPSGSTAYSMSAGGSMVAPSVPCTLITPMSPHSLSFRPLIIPEGSLLTVRVPPFARSHARAAFDGKHPCRVHRGGAVRFRTSLCPLPLISKGSLDSDWYEGITQKLKWNQSIRGAPSTLEGWEQEHHARHLPADAEAEAARHGRAAAAAAAAAKAAAQAAGARVAGAAAAVALNGNGRASPAARRGRAAP